MKNSTKIVLGALAAIVLVSTAAVLTPHATRARAASPDPFSPTAPRTPWANYCAPPAAPPNIYYTSCTITAPSGGELVIQQISGYQITPAPTRQMVGVSTNYTAPFGWTTMLVPEAIQGKDYYFWSYPVTLYADPGSAITIKLVNQNRHPLTTLDSTVNLVGYYVTPPPS